MTTDWESLSKKLKALGVELGKDKQHKMAHVQKFPIEDVVEGSYWEGLFGAVFCHDNVFAPEYCHGTQSIQPTQPITTICQWAQASELSHTDLGKFVFLDTETSGLAGGTGTYAFEIGLGRFTEEGFHLAQFFMRHPGEEPALLAALTKFTDGMEAVVTYNGKAFDIPLLNTRYTLMGMTSPFISINHFDLLPLARRLWRIRLESRTLSNVEEKILGVTRGEEEVPGYMIPQMYFDYLNTQDARPLKGIFYHNAIDILSLAGLFSHMADLLHNPHNHQVKHIEDVVALARFFEAMNNTIQAEQLYYRALKQLDKDDLYWDTLERLSFLLKRKGVWPAAISLWKKAAENQQLYAFEELAKYYEHHAKDAQTAKFWTVKALETLANVYLPPYQYQLWQESLSHRLNRLEKRLSNLDKS